MPTATTPFKTNTGGRAKEGIYTPGSSQGPTELSDLNALYPAFEPVEFPTIKTAPYTFTDPQQFAQQYGEFNRQQFGKNFASSKDYALESLNTELKGLQAFAPAAAALKREQVALDNTYNQWAKSAQIRQVMPEAFPDLAKQRERALAYAEGRLPNEQLDRSLELGMRSRAADAAGYAGFGPKSMQAQKISDLMSAEQRFTISQYGEQLFGQNLQTKATLGLAPLEYAETGAEIRAAPEIGAGRLTYQGLGMLNQQTMIDPTTAMSANIAQNQFTTGLEQQTRMFNATGQFQAAQFNSAGAFTAGLGQFNYNVGLDAAAVAQNQGLIDQMYNAAISGIQNNGASQGLTAGQQTGQIQSVASTIGQIGNAAQGITNMINGTSSDTKTEEDVPKKTTTETPTAKLYDETPTSPNWTPSAKSIDASTPSTLKFAQGVATPQGYVPVANNNDGTYSAAKIDDYKADLDRFARTSGFTEGKIEVENAAKADKALSDMAGLSYVPLPNFQPMAMTGAGKRVFSFPALANSADTGMGRNSILNLGIGLSTLGVNDPAIMAALGQSYDFINKPNLIPSLDATLAERGQGAVTEALLNGAVGGKPNLDSAAGQQLAFMANRIGEVWGGLSPAQKSLAVAALTNSSVQVKTGKNPGDQVIPGTDRSLAGGLRVGDAWGLTMAGINGHALARNWNQLSTIGNLVGGTKGATEIARIANSIGLLGYGPQGASVPVDDTHFTRTGAEPMPAMGVGAVAFKNRSDVPKHYQTVAQTPDGRTIAMPSNLMHTSVLKVGGPTPLAYEKAKSIASGGHPAQKYWGKPPLMGVTRGATGGSAIVSGLNIMRNANPEMLGSIITHSLFNNVHGG